MIQTYQILIYVFKFNPIQTGLLQSDVSVRETWEEGEGPGGNKVNKKEKQKIYIYINCANGLLFVVHCTGMISQSE